MLPDAAARASRRVESLLRELDPIGHEAAHPEAGYHRAAWTPEDLQLRGWFRDRAEGLGLRLEQDRVGNLWAWWLPEELATPGDIRPGTAITCGSHLDSVPGGGRYDGPLGVVSALVAVELLQETGWTPAQPLGIVCFSDEEGARFRIACFGSRVLTGVLSAERALACTAEDGTPLASALADGGVSAAGYGPDPSLLARIRGHVELHVEQGYALAPAAAPLGVATAIWPHGRWHVALTGEANHAGTTPLERRDDPTLRLADLIRTAREAAEKCGGVATVGKILVTPNGVNVIPSQVDAWVDVRAPDEAVLDAILQRLDGFGLERESRTPATHFDPDLAETLGSACAAATGAAAPRIPTAAGHDAGILQDAGIPSGMLFVRSTTGASHTPAEAATEADCGLGALSLAEALRRLERAR
jgi:N-carbamoyl-L-amino-acid hydrolase